MIAPPQDPHRDYIAKYDEPRLHVEALMNAHMITQDLPSRYLFPLSDVGIRRVRDLLVLVIDWKKLRSIKMIGAGAEKEIRRVLHNAGLMGMETEKNLKV